MKQTDVRNVHKINTGKTQTRIDYFGLTPDAIIRKTS